MMKVVLVYGARKSGTTLLQRLLDGGGLFSLPSETKIKAFARLQHLIEKGADLSAIAHRGTTALRWFFPFEATEESRLEDDEYYRYISANLPSVSCLRAYVSLQVESMLSNVHEESMLKDYKSGFIIKEVGGKKVMSHFLSAFPEGKVVAIVRNPLYTASAVFRQRKKSARQRLCARQVFSQAQRPWRVTREIIDEKINERILVVSYENIVHKTRDTVRFVSEFLALPRLPEPVPTMNEKKTIVRTASRVDTNVFARGEKWHVGLSVIECLACLWALLTHAPTAYRLRKQFPSSMTLT
jgi:hypothetical protein